MTPPPPTIDRVPSRPQLDSSADGRPGPDGSRSPVSAASVASRGVAR